MSAQDRIRLLQQPPRVIAGVELVGLELDVTAGFLLSHIDGATSAELLCDLTALDEETVVSVLTRLEQLRVIAWASEVADEGTLKAEPALHNSPRSPIEARHHDLPELDEPCDLTREQKALVMAAERSLAGGTHWDLLCLTGDPGADEIKRAYLKACKTFHPDRYFGKGLGSFRARIEAIFRRLKDAYEVLGDEARREAYRAVHPPPRSVPSPSQPTAAAPAAPRQSPASPVEPDVDEEQQRRLQERRAAIADRRRKKRVQESRRAPDKALELYESGLSKLNEGSYGEAASALQLAVTYAPREAAYAAALAQAKQLAGVQRASRLAEVAEVEAAAGHASRAAELYAEAAVAAPDNGRYTRRAAEQFHAAGLGEEAWLHAERALAVASDRKDVRVLAAVILERDGRKSEALEHLRAAAELDADDVVVRKAIARLSRS